MSELENESFSNSQLTPTTILIRTIGSGDLSMKMYFLVSFSRWTIGLYGGQKSLKKYKFFAVLFIIQ